jgi:hypothetical protein
VQTSIRSISSALLFAAVSSAWGAVGTIRGTVVNDTGQPVADAKVWAEPADRPQIGRLQFQNTDKDGAFVLSGLELGSYHVFAMKEEDGYPNIGFGFHSGGPMFTAALTDRITEVGLVVRIGPRAGLIVGSISDAATGKPVKARVEMRHVKNENNFLRNSVNPNFRLLVPPDAKITFTVSADGYETWYYPGYIGAVAAAPLTLRSGEEKTLDIKLQPAAAARPNP